MNNLKELTDELKGELYWVNGYGDVCDVIDKLLKKFEGKTK